ncbi:MAG TPA: TonB family protein [Pyrinomonadaceae bacterium]|nr:TonB family protein [Pyrinomonadaceae bacterium]
MNCLNCGGALPPGVRFCPKCGSPVAQPPPTAPQAYVPPGEQMQTSWELGPYGQSPPRRNSPPRRKSRAGKILLIVLVSLILLGAGAGLAVYYGYKQLESTLKSSEAYQLAESELRRSRAVAEKMGEITNTGFPVGSYKVEADGSGFATYTVSVEGTKASGRYFVTMTRAAGVWNITRAFVQIKDGESVSVVGGSEEGEQANAEEAVVVDDAGAAQADEDASATTGGKALSAGVLNGKAVSKPAPPYPPMAKAAKASGTVVVSVEVDEKGVVTSARAVSGHPLLRAAAEAAARRARFSPTLLSGRPVKVQGVLTYDFRLE